MERKTLAEQSHSPSNGRLRCGHARNGDVFRV